MSDYYVMFEGTQYEVESFAAGIAKAQELGTGAVFYVNAPISASSHAYCQGVTTIFSGGSEASNRYPFGGANGTSLATTNMTIADGKYAYVFGGGLNSAVENSYLTMTGGSVTNLFAGGWGASPAAAIGGTAHVTFAGGTAISFYCGGYNGGVLDATEVTIQGGSISSLVGTHKDNGAIGSITINFAGGYVKGNIEPGAGSYTQSGETIYYNGTFGDITLNLTGGTVAGAVYGGGRSAVEVRTGVTVINIDGFEQPGRYVYGMWRSAPKAITVNMKSGYVYVLSCGGNATQAEAIVAEAPVTVNMTGGSIGYLLGGSYNWVTMKGGININISGGVIINGVRGGGWRAGYTDTIGDVTINLTGGTILQQVTAGGAGTLEGNSYVSVSGDVLWKRNIYGGAMNGDVTGNTNVTVTGGQWETASAWILGGCVNGDVLGKATITITDADVYHVFGGGNAVDADVLGGVEINVTGSTVHGVLMGGGYKGAIEGGASINITNSLTTTEMVANFGACGWIVGAGYAGDSEGDVAVVITGSTIQGSIIGGTDWQTAHDGGIALTVGNSVIGMTTDEGAYEGNIYLLGYYGTEIVGETFSATITDTFMAGAFYLGYGGNYFEGDTAIAISDSTIGDGFYLEYGDFTEDPDTGEFVSGNTTEIQGDVALSLANVVVEGDVWGKSRNYDLAAFTEGHGITLSIAGSFSATGEVGYFSNINLAANSTIVAGTTTASAITAEAAAADGLYALATGFAAQASTITVVGNGGVLGAVTLTDEITSGSFTAGSDTYNVGISDDVLYLGKNTAIPEPTPPPPTPTETVAEVILTITDPNHEFVGATGGWKIQADQTVEWQDLTTLGTGYAYLGLGATTAGKAMPDIYVYNAEAKYVAAYVTDDTGAVTGFESIFLGESALMQVGLADFNADGVSDLMLRTADGFVGYYANGAFAEVQGLGLEWTVAALGDVDGNGRADIIIAHEQGYVGAYLIGADGSISWADLGNIDATTAIVGAGDVNGDDTDDVIVQVGSNYFGAWLCGQGAVTGFFGIGEFNAEVQGIADYNADGTDDLLFRTAGGVVGAALITGADATTWSEYGAVGPEWAINGCAAPAQNFL